MRLFRRPFTLGQVPTDPERPNYHFSLAHLREAAPAHQAVLGGGGVIALSLVVAGIYVVVATSRSAGLGVGILVAGVAFAVLTAALVLRSQHRMASLPPDEAHGVPKDPAPSLPVVFLAFANGQPEEHLALLKAEASAVRRMLRPLWSTGRIQVHREESATLDEIASALNDFLSRVVVFHYAGHADSTRLAFEEGRARAGPFGALLATEQNLRLVVLNGCATEGQVAALWDAGVPAVIATRVPVGDARAKDFATAFYNALGVGATLSTAFGRAASLDGSTHDAGRARIHTTRSLDTDLEPAEEFPWGLWIHPDREQELLNWSLGENVLDSTQP